MKKKTKLTLAVTAISITTASCISLIKEKEATSIRYLDQGWNQEDRELYYRMSQGTFTLPLSWMKALEQSGGFGEQNPLMDKEYLTRFWFYV